MVAWFAAMSRWVSSVSPVRSRVTTLSSPHARRVAAIWEASCGVSLASSFGATASFWTIAGYRTTPSSDTPR